MPFVYDAEMKARALELVAQGRDVHSVAAELGPGPTTIAKWVERQNGFALPKRRPRLKLRSHLRDLLLDIAATWKTTQDGALERLVLEAYERECGKPSDPRDEAKELFARLALVLKARVE